MKNILKKVIILIVCFILCACSVKNENTLTIDQNGKLRYNVLIALDKSLIESLTKMNIIKKDKKMDISEYVSENIKDDYLDGFAKNEYSNSEYMGNEYIYTVNSIDDVSTEDNIAVILNKNSIVNKNLFTKKNGIYTANLLYNLNDKYNYENVEFNNTFTVNLPVKALSSNADQVLNEGKTLIWNIKNGESKAINFKFTFQNVKSYISLGLIAFDIVIIIVLVILIIRRRIKHEKEIN